MGSGRLRASGWSAAKSRREPTISSVAMNGFDGASGAELLASLCPSCSQHAPAALRLHAGQEAVLLGAMPFLWLVGHLAHDGPGSLVEQGRDGAGRMVGPEQRRCAPGLVSLGGAVLYR